MAKRGTPYLYVNMLECPGVNCEVLLSNGRCKLIAIKRSDADKYACKARNSEGLREAIVLLVGKSKSYTYM